MYKKIEVSISNDNYAKLIDYTKKQDIDMSSAINDSLRIFFSQRKMKNNREQINKKTSSILLTFVLGLGVLLAFIIFNMAR